VKSADKHAATLVSVGLWDTTQCGWLVHDYLSHQKSSDTMKAITAERREAGHRGGLASGVSRKPRSKTEANQRSNIEAKLKQQYEPDQNRSEQTRKDLGADAPIARAQAITSAIYSTEHRKHAHCGRICLHASLFGEFVRRRGTPTADAELRDWAMQVEREWGIDGPKRDVEPGDAWEFWRARYAEQWPSTDAVTTKSRSPAWAR
jgi:hypothetical protein